MSYLYTIFIFPLVQILELCFTFTFRVFKNAGLSIIGISIFISFLILPFYFFAETIQKKEKELQKKMRLKIEKIKSVFKGDEQYMILSAYYKQNNYHPIYSLRNSINLLIQIPFFIAAYYYISHMQMLKGLSFIFIQDLGKPDALISIGNISINLLPSLMTIINLLSGIIYSRNLGRSEKYQLYIMSIVFLLLLYNSPSALVLYWTMNNIFSLIKNIIQKKENPKRIIYIITIPIIIFIDLFLFFIHRGDLPNRLLAIFLFSLILLFPLLKKITGSTKIILFSYFKNENYLPSYIFILSCLILFMLNGIVIPSSLISSSVSDFSFIGSYTTPIPFIIETSLQSIGIFLFWPIIIYFVFSKRIRNILSYIMIILAVVSLINVFTITENFGFFTTTMLFSDPKSFSLIPYPYILNIIILSVVLILLFFILFKNKKNFILSGQIIAISSLLIISIINIKQINDDYQIIKEKYMYQDKNLSNLEIEYTFSKTGKIVLFIFLDTAIGSYVPFIFEEKPELLNSMYGFNYYLNCVSFSNHTLIGGLPVFGGYEYTPISINKRGNTSLLDKQKEAYLLLPYLFSKEGYSITITDPPFDNFKATNLSIFSDYPEFDVKNLIGKYTASWLRENKDIETINISELLKNNLLCFSFLKCAPLFLRLFIYDRGNWLKLKENSNNQLTISIIDDYSFLYNLNKITEFSENGDTFTSIYSHLPHDSAMLQAPDYIPVNNVTNIGTSIFADNSTYNLTIASFLLLGKWFDFLKENEVYDNTRIIIVSDHGRGSLNIHNNIRLPNGDLLYTYNPVLMFKDFYTFGSPVQHDEFMSNGDAIFFAMNGIINEPINPFTNTLLKPDKDNGITLTTIGAVSTYRHGKNIYNIGSQQWLYVNNNIFISDNWRVITE